MSGQNSNPVSFGPAGGRGPSPLFIQGGTSSGFRSPPPFRQTSNINGSSMDVCGTPFAFQNPLRPNLSSSKAVSPFSTDRSKTDASDCKESKHEQKLQCEEIEKSVQSICKDIIRHQEDMKSLIERYRSLELEKIEDTRTIKQLREELAEVTKSKDAIIAEYLESPAFTKRLDEEHEKRLSEIFHPSYVKALRTVQQTKLPDIVQTELPGTFQTTELRGTVQTKLPEIDSWEMVPLHKATVNGY